MKKLLAIALMTFSMASFAQVKGVYVEEIDNNGIVPGRTYRIYLECTSAADRVVNIFAYEGYDMYWRSTKPFFQSAYGGPLSTSIIRATLRDKPELRYDSWFTIGYVDNYSNAVSGFNLNFDKFENGEELVSSDGAFYVTPDKPQCKPNDDLRVLIAQLTTEGIITAKFSVQGRTIKEGTIDPETGKGSVEWDNWQIHDLTFTAGDK